MDETQIEERKRERTDYLVKGIDDRAQALMDKNLIFGRHEGRIRTLLIEFAKSEVARLVEGRLREVPPTKSGRITMPYPRDESLEYE